MKKLNIKKNGNFSVISHAYVLYGNKHGNACYIHFEEKSGTCYMVEGEWEDVLKLVREKISWKQFAGIVSYEYNMQTQVEEYYSL